MRIYRSKILLRFARFLIPILVLYCLLYVTNKGIFYDGDKKNIKLAWDKIMRETINSDSIQLEKSNGSPVLLNGYIDPNEAAIMTLTGQLYESL